MVYLLKKSHAHCGGKNSCQGSGAATAETLLPGTAWEKHSETLHLQHAFHRRKGALTNASPAVAAKQHTVKGEKEAQPKAGAATPSQLHPYPLPQFPLLQNKVHSINSFIKPSNKKPAPLTSKDRVSAVRQLTHSRGAVTGISCIEKITGTIKLRNSKTLC